jgi:hypothetical protein
MAAWQLQGISRYFCGENAGDNAGRKALRQIDR